jgi:hypothetical protein
MSCWYKVANNSIMSDIKNNRLPNVVICNHIDDNAESDNTCNNIIKNSTNITISGACQDTLIDECYNNIFIGNTSNNTVKTSNQILSFSAGNTIINCS